MDSEKGQEQRRQASVEQERSLNKTPDASFTAVEIPNFLESWKTLFPPLDDAGIFVDDKLDAVGHRFKSGQRHHAFHRCREHVKNGRPERHGLYCAFSWKRRNAAEV